LVFLAQVASQRPQRAGLATRGRLHDGQGVAPALLDAQHVGAQRHIGASLTVE
jgi:hypothetical protein